MIALRPFWRYFGGKWRATRHYPEPRYGHIIEPFSGAAGYACHYPSHQVTLIDRSPIIAGIWKYLVRVSPEEILAIPDIPDGGTVDDLPCCQEARWLAGFWCNQAAASPRKRNGAWVRNPPPDAWGIETLGWRPKVRQRIAAQVPMIRHWQIVEGDYHDAPDIEATWFVDPPYQVAGKNYPYHAIDYPDLATWCRSRRGHVMVCEAEGADWLPFEPLAVIKSAAGRGRTGTSREVIWPAIGLQGMLFR